MTTNAFADSKRQRESIYIKIGVMEVKFAKR